MRLRNISCALALAALAAGCASTDRTTLRLDAELDEISALWTGDFAGAAALPPTGEQGIIVHIAASIVAPQFGERVFVYQLHRDSADGPLLQQKVFAFDTNPARTENRMRAWVFAPEQLDPGVVESPSKWRTLNPDELKDFPDGCAFRWRDTRAGYAGWVSAKECRFASRAFGRAVRPDMRYELTPDVLIWDEALSDDDGATLASTGGPLTAERGGPIVDVRWNHYDVRGESHAEIRQSLYSQSPVFADGEIRVARTEWDLNWIVDPRETETGCDAGAVAVRVDIATLLPRLEYRDSVPAEVKVSWDAFMDALLMHALRHRRHAVEAARAIRARVARLPQAATCDALLADADRIAAGVVDVARRRDRQFDATTRYGEADGAEFPRAAE